MLAADDTYVKQQENDMEGSVKAEASAFGAEAENNDELDIQLDEDVSHAVLSHTTVLLTHCTAYIAMCCGHFDLSASRMHPMKTMKTMITWTVSRQRVNVM